jgi:hypothetical protein
MPLKDFRKQLAKTTDRLTDRLGDRVSDRVAELSDRLATLTDRAEAYQSDLRKRVRPQPARRGRSLIALCLGLCTGAAIAYFADGQEGARRRQQALARLRKLFASTGAPLQGAAIKARDKAAGRIRQAGLPPDNPDADDLTLVSRVESELFRDRSIPKGKINIGAVDGTVILRGELDDASQIDGIVAAVNKIVGVREVENLLHTPGTPAPNKASARGIR